MKIKTVNRYITAILIIMILFNLAAYLFTNYLYERRSELLENGHDIMIYSDKLQDIDFILTKAVRNYTITGQIKYKNLYDSISESHNSREWYIYRIDDQTTKLFGNNNIKAFIPQMLIYAKKISDEEKRAVDEYNKGNHAEARNIIYSPIFMELDQEFKLLSDSLLARYGNQKLNELDKLDTIILVCKIIMICVLILNIGLSIIFVFFFYSKKVILPIDRLSKQTVKLLSGENISISIDERDATELINLSHILNKYSELVNDLKSERKKLATISDELQTIFECAPIGIVKIENRVIKQCNKKMDDILGYAHGEQIGKSTRIWYSDDASFSQTGREVEDAIKNNKIFIREAQWVRKDGNKTWARFTAHAIEQNEMNKGLVITVEDTTIERAATAAIEEAKMIAENAARVKTEFLSNMSHEIRTPMNAIIGLTHLTLKSDPNEIQKKYLNKIQYASQHLLTIINDILDISKLEAKKITLENRPFDLDEVMNELISIVGDKANEKGLELLFYIDDQVPRSMIGDSMRLGQILLNLITNAIKFTEKGEIILSISTVKRTATEAILAFSVKDSGIGISQADINNLFKSFSQADSSTTRKYGGSGLGLSISKQLVELMHGKIDVSSTTGEGSTFRFTATFEINQYTPRRLLPRPDLRGMHILYICDKSPAFNITDSMLNSMTFIVSSANSEQQVITAMQETLHSNQPYPIILLDWNTIANQEGHLHQLIRQQMTSNQPYILILATDEQEVKKHVTPNDKDHILMKPVTPSQLFDSILAFFSDNKETETKHTEPSPLETQIIAGAHILLVDDNELNLEVGTELLKEAGLIVDQATNGKMAIEKIQAYPYDLILMDVQMPIMDGLTATKELRKDSKFNNLPILALTASAFASDRDQCIAAGMNDHIGKPINPQELLSKLIQWIKPKSQTIKVSNHKPISKPISDSHIKMLKLDQIADLDYQTGLRYAMQRENLYISLLEKFISSQSSFEADFDKAMLSNDLNTAERLAHTLKSSSAQIGANSLKSLAEKLEFAAKSKKTETLETNKIQVTKQLIKLITALKDCLNSLEKYTPDKPESQTLKSNPDEICQQLLTALAKDDYQSNHLIEEYRDLLQTHLGDAFTGIEKAIEAFDFAAAQKLLEDAISKQP